MPTITRRVGEAKPVFETATATTGTITIQSGGTVLLKDRDGDTVGGYPQALTGYDVPAAASRRVWHNLDATGLAEGEYTLEFIFSALGSDGITRNYRRPVTVFVAETNLLDEYLRSIRSVLQIEDYNEETAPLLEQDLLRCLQRAVRKFSEDLPRIIVKDVTLTANQWEYALSTLTTGVTPAAAWVHGFSEILKIEPDVDATVQTRTFEGPLAFSVDFGRSIWRFEVRSPSLGDTARVWWKTWHTLSPTVDTMPTDAAGDPAWLEEIAVYAAGLALKEPQAAKWLQTAAPRIAGDIVSYDQRSQGAMKLGPAMMKYAREQWKPTVYYL